MIQHQFHQANLDLSQWMKLAASVLSHMAHTAAVVTAPKSSQSYFKHLQLLLISDNLILLGFTAGKEMDRTIRIIKTRGSAHDNQQYRLDISNKGAAVLK